MEHNDCLRALAFVFINRIQVLIVLCLHVNFWRSNAEKRPEFQLFFFLNFDSENLSYCKRSKPV